MDHSVAAAIAAEVTRQWLSLGLLPEHKRYDALIEICSKHLGSTGRLGCLTAHPIQADDLTDLVSRELAGPDRPAQGQGNIASEERS
jgi:hypothetical protein